MIELNHAQISNRVHKFKLVKVSILKAMGLKFRIILRKQPRFRVIIDVHDVVKFSAKAEDKRRRLINAGTLVCNE